MLGDIFSESEWKRWWDSTKKLLNKEGYFLIPTKKSEPIQLRGEKVSRANELIAFLIKRASRRNRQPRSTRSSSFTTNSTNPRRSCSRSSTRSKKRLREINGSIQRSCSSWSWRVMI